jgi:putative tryptophan/tyrosine transport system substrate-binding protein
MTLSRRRFVQGTGLVGVGLLVGCGRWPGQGAAAAPRVAQVGWLTPFSPDSAAQARNIIPFREGMQEHGWTEGGNFVIEPRFAYDRDDRLPGLAAELVRLPVDIIVTVGGTSTQAASEATIAVPIVFATGGYALDGSRWSVARPRGYENVTGITTLTAPLTAKRLQLLKETVPHIARVAVLYGEAAAFEEAQRAASTLAVELHSVRVDATSDLERALEDARAWGAEALAFESHPIFSAASRRLAEFTTEYRLPAISGLGGFAEAGGLMHYSPRTRLNFKRAAAYVDRILKGAKPADLPIEQPREFDLAINLKTAQALGLTIPPHVLLQATEIIQ